MRSGGADTSLAARPARDTKGEAVDWPAWNRDHLPKPPKDDAEAPTPSATSEPGQPSADEARVEQVLAALAAAVLVIGTARSVPQLRQPLALVARATRRRAPARTAYPLG